ncbi:Uncharacterized protein SCF082_LOCUS50913 [Durusdinium trenchii]|uniref:Uncharacterized protein n=1 Tax=Durusdinium trenchii TaxID=1381693 RepID=A0ABP0SB04_9DINO
MSHDKEAQIQQLLVKAAMRRMKAAVPPKESKGENDTFIELDLEDSQVTIPGGDEEAQAMASAAYRELKAMEEANPQGRPVATPLTVSAVQPAMERRDTLAYVEDTEGLQRLGHIPSKESLEEPKKGRKRKGTEAKEKEVEKRGKQEEANGQGQAAATSSAEAGKVEAAAANEDKFETQESQMSVGAILNRPSSQEFMDFTSGGMDIEDFEKMFEESESGKGKKDDEKKAGKTTGKQEAEQKEDEKSSKEAEGKEERNKTSRTAQKKEEETKARKKAQKEEEKKTNEKAKEKEEKKTSKKAQKKEVENMTNEKAEEKDEKNTSKKDNKKEVENNTNEKAEEKEEKKTSKAQKKEEEKATNEKISKKSDEKPEDKKAGEIHKVKAEDAEKTGVNSPPEVRHLAEKARQGGRAEKTQKLQVLYEQWIGATEKWSASQLVVRMRNRKLSKKVGGRRFMTEREIIQRYGEEVAADIIANKESKHKEDPEAGLVKAHPESEKLKLYLCWDQEYEQEEEDNLIEMMYEDFDGDMDDFGNKTESSDKGKGKRVAKSPAKKDSGKRKKSSSSSSGPPSSSSAGSSSDASSSSDSDSSSSTDSSESDKKKKKKKARKANKKDRKKNSKKDKKQAKKNKKGVKKEKDAKSKKKNKKAEKEKEEKEKEKERVRAEKEAEKEEKKKEEKRKQEIRSKCKKSLAQCTGCIADIAKRESKAESLPLALQCASPATKHPLARSPAIKAAIPECLNQHKQTLKKSREACQAVLDADEAGSIPNLERSFKGPRQDTDL